MGCVAMRDNTSRNQAKGSTRQRLQVAMKLIRMAERPTAIVASEKGPVAAPDGDVAIGPLGRTIIDFQVSILDKP